MRRSRGGVLAAALTLGVACGGVPYDHPEGGGGADGFAEHEAVRPDLPVAPARAAGDSNELAMPAGDGTGLAELPVTDGMAIAVGELAAERSANDQVRSFGTQLAADYRRMTTKATAAIEGSPAHTTSSAVNAHDVQQRFVDRTGADFDRAVLAALVDELSGDIAAYERAAQSASASVRAEAEEALAVLRTRLREARDLQARL